MKYIPLIVVSVLVAATLYATVFFIVPITLKNTIMAFLAGWTIGNWSVAVSKFLVGE